MPTTIRVEEDVKRDFDRLQGLLQAESGERLSHSELLARMLRVARRHERELYEKAGPAQPRLSADQIRKRLGELAIDVGPSDVRDVDEVLYGERP